MNLSREQIKEAVAKAIAGNVLSVLLEYHAKGTSEALLTLVLEDAMRYVAEKAMEMAGMTTVHEPSAN